MNEKVKEFIDLYVEGSIVEMDYSNKRTWYVDCELKSFLEIEDIDKVEELNLTDIMNDIVLKIENSEDELFNAWVSSSNEITVERKDYINFKEMDMTY